MTTPTSPLISPFALTPVQIPLDITPVSQGDVGLGIVNHFQDPTGVMIVFGPYQGQTLLETLHLLLNGNPTPISSTVVQSNSAPVVMRMPPGLLLEGVNILECEVERMSGNREKSPPLDVLYHTFAPGGDDLVAGGGHSNLASSISHPIVDATQAAQGVTLTVDYSHKHLYDVITIDCGGVIITVQIAPTVADPNPDLTKPIEIILTTQHFANDRNNPLFEIKYNVRSETGNLSGTTQFGVFDPQDHWSKALVIDVRMDQVLLEQPILREVLSDNNDKPEEVDLDKMNGGPLWALIHLIQAIWKPGDQIHLIVEAWVNGAVVDSYDVTITVGQVPGQISIDIPNVNVIAGSQLKVWYEQIRGGKIIGISKEALAQVVGIGLPELKMDESPVHLSAERYYADQIQHAFPEYLFPSHPKSGSYLDRKATGGVDPITYSSSDTGIVSVDQNGRSYARGNGKAIVTAIDAANQSKSFEITTAGTAHQVVFRYWTPGLTTWKDATQFSAASGGRLFTLSEIQSHSSSFTPAKYRGPDFHHGTWTSTPGTHGGLPAYWIGRWDGSHFLHLDNPSYVTIYVFLKSGT